MSRIISIATGEGRPPCLPLGLFEGAPGQNLPDCVHLVSPSCPRPWLRFLIIPGRKVEKSWRFVKINQLAWLRGKEQMDQEAR